MVSPRDLVCHWVDVFNSANSAELAMLYHPNATNHQVANEPVVGRAAIEVMFEQEFSQAEMICIPENIFEDGDWGILEWRDPIGARGSGFFQFNDGLIVFQRGYWDRLSIQRLREDADSR